MFLALRGSVFVAAIMSFSEPKGLGGCGADPSCRQAAVSLWERELADACPLLCNGRERRVSAGK